MQKQEVKKHLSNRQIWPWSTEWSRAEANRVLPRERTGHRKNPFQQQKRRLCTWTSPDGQNQNQIDYILCSQRWRTSIQSAKTRLGTDCGSDHELFIAKFRLKLKKVGETTRPFRYDLNQIPYDYTVEVRNRFKWLDLIDRVPDELWTEVSDIVQETGSKTIPKKKKCKKAIWGSLTNSCEKKRSQKQRRKGNIYHLNVEFQRIARRDKKAFLSDQCKEIGKTTEWERLEISSRKLELPREHFMKRWAQ